MIDISALSPVYATKMNAELIHQGYAQILTIPPNVKYADRFRELQQEARENHCGLWAEQEEAKPEAQKGNGSSIVYVTKTGKKYHKDGCKSLAKSKIPTPLKDAVKKYTPCSICNPPTL